MGEDDRDDTVGFTTRRISRDAIARAVPRTRSDEMYAVRLLVSAVLDDLLRLRRQRSGEELRVQIAQLIASARRRRSRRDRRTERRRSTADRRRRHRRSRHSKQSRAPAHCLVRRLPGVADASEQCSMALGDGTSRPPSSSPDVICERIDLHVSPRPSQSTDARTCDYGLLAVDVPRRRTTSCSRRSRSTSRARGTSPPPALAPTPSLPRASRRCATRLARRADGDERAGEA